MNLKRIAAFAILFSALTTTGVANADRGARPVGTWLVSVTFPQPGPAPFTELLVLHQGGTITETNTTLHANSADNPASPLPLNGSLGAGAWKKAGKNRIKFTFVKLVFNAGGEHEGYLRVAGTAKIRGNQFEATTETELLFGTDINNPFNVIPFGSAPSTGQRIKAH